MRTGRFMQQFEATPRQNTEGGPLLTGAFSERIASFQYRLTDQLF
jgi:hypothetical protein